MSEIYFWADPHFGHANIMKYCSRPFQSVEEMNEVLVARWNARVKPGDNIYVLGDFMWARRRDDIEMMLSRLNGNKFLVIGNHDSKDARRAKS